MKKGSITAFLLTAAMTFFPFPVFAEDNSPASPQMQVVTQDSASQTVSMAVKYVAKADDVKDAVIALEQTEFDYTGSPIEPAFTVTMNIDGETVTLVPGEDFTFAYSDNTDANASASVTITGIGYFTGTKTAHFVINSLETEQPETDPPETDQPETDPTETDPPETDQPETDPTETEQPETEQPETDPTETEQPASEPTTTEPPVTESTEPTTTEPPTTEPPATEPTTKKHYKIKIVSSTSLEVPEGWYTSLGGFENQAWRDFEDKHPGDERVFYADVKQIDENTVECSIYEWRGNRVPLDVYTIDVRTGIGTNLAGEEINLPQTGVTSWNTAAAVGGAFVLVSAGLLLTIKASRRKKDEE